ncbi:MAG: TadE/TadG family type IV pilus assembly protein [Pontixanthobacter sp.]
MHDIGRLTGLLRNLRRDRSGVALIEFAYSLPLLALLSMGGIELANFTIMNMRVSQAAMQIADNASRIGDRDSLVAQKVYEGDIEDIFLGVDIEAGAQTKLFEQGRVIVSSLEQNSEGGQWIHWQRCMGKKRVSSAYGGAGTGKTGTGFAGMGPSGEELQASPNQAIIYVEIIYDYEPLLTNDYAVQAVTGKTIRSQSAFNVRGTRDLEKIYDTPSVSPRTCDKYNDS